jgi:hypothetical protein
MVRSPTKAGPARTDQDLLVAIEAIYAAALSPDLWPAALSRIADLCGAKWTILSAIPINPISPGTTVQNEEGDPAQLALFSRRFTTPENNPAIPVLLTSPVGRITLQEEHFTPKQWERTKIYNEVYRPAGVHASLGVPLLRSEGYLVPLGVMRDRARGKLRSVGPCGLGAPHPPSAECRQDNVAPQRARRPYGRARAELEPARVWRDPARPEGSHPVEQSGR